MNQRGRTTTAVVAVLVVSLIAAGAARYWAMSYRARTAPPGTEVTLAAGSGSRLSAMPSFATALLLGGLRGPLVMMLWTSSESQKADKNLEDFDTKVEWIRLLQPEFDSVHIFQIWNKAYNISVQMASMANKYATILDALEYAQRIQKQRPNNINIEVAIADIYFNKLGMSAEKEYYTRRVRQETQFRPQAGPRPGDVGWRRTRLDPMLDAKGNILPEYAEELQYLKKYEPFPYGLTPFPIAYNYYRRAQILQSEGGQSHLQLSGQVLDSRPALTLKNWSEFGLEHGRRLEMAMFERQAAGTERLDLELPTAQLALDAKPVKPELYDEALHSYARSAAIAKDSAEGYTRHLREFGTDSANFSTFNSHIDHMHVIEAIARADHAYLAATRAGGSDRSRLVAEARKAYEQAIAAAEVTILKYFVDDGLLQAIGLPKEQIANLPPQALHQAMAAVRDAIKRQLGGEANAEDRQEYEIYIQRAAARLAQLPQT